MSRTYKFLVRLLLVPIVFSLFMLANLWSLLVYTYKPTWFPYILGAVVALQFINTIAQVEKAIKDEERRLQGNK